MIDAARTKPLDTRSRIAMYGTLTCADCRRSRALLDSLKVEYDFINIEDDQRFADQAVAISGRMSTPVIVFPDGTFVVEPTDADLLTKLAGI